MGAHSTKILDDIKNILSIFKDVIKEISDGVKSLAGFDLIDKAIEELSRVSSQFTTEEKETLKCIIAANKKVTLAMNHAKDIVSDAKRLANTLKEVMNSKAVTGNDNKVRLAIKVFEKDLTGILPKLSKARDDLSVASTELQEIVLKLKIIKNWCLAKKQELECKKDSSIAKERANAYGGATGATVAVAGTVAVVNWWNPVGWISGMITGVTTFTSAGVIAFSVAIGVAEGATIPQLKQMYDEGIKGLEESANKFQDMSDGNKKRSKRLSEKLDQLREIVSVAQQANNNASSTLQFDIDDIMFNVLKKDVEELESLCDNFLRI